MFGVSDNYLQYIWIIKHDVFCEILKAATTSYTICLSFVTTDSIIVYRNEYIYILKQHDEYFVFAYSIQILLLHAYFYRRLPHGFPQT